MVTLSPDQLILFKVVTVSKLATVRAMHLVRSEDHVATPGTLLTKKTQKQTTSAKQKKARNDYSSITHCKTSYTPKPGYIIHYGVFIYP